MRKLYGLLAAAAMLFVVAAPAGAATLSISGGTFSLSIGALPGITGAVTAAPSIAVSSTTGGFTEPAGIMPVTVVLPTELFTGVSLISSLNLTANNGTGTFAAGAGLNGGFGGAGALSGQSVVGVLGGLINLVIPLGNVGVGGNVAVIAAALAVTVTGTIWTTGAAQVTGITTTTTAPNGQVNILNTLTLTGYDNRNGSGVGSIMLVTPVRILTNAAGNLPSFASQVLTFVPEPGILLLMGTGFAGLVALGRQRSRK